MNALPAPVPAAQAARQPIRLTRRGRRARAAAWGVAVGGSAAAFWLGLVCWIADQLLNK